MNWLERARSEIGQSAVLPTANSAERNPTTVTAVPERAIGQNADQSIGSNGSARSEQSAEIDAVRDVFEERAAIMEYEGRPSLENAEVAAWELVTQRGRHALH